MSADGQVADPAAEAHGDPARQPLATSLYLPSTEAQSSVENDFGGLPAWLVLWGTQLLLLSQASF